MLGNTARSKTSTIVRKFSGECKHVICRQSHIGQLTKIPISIRKMRKAFHFVITKFEK